MKTLARNCWTRSWLAVLMSLTGVTMLTCLEPGPFPPIFDALGIHGLLLLLSAPLLAIAAPLIPAWEHLRHQMQRTA